MAISAQWDQLTGHDSERRAPRRPLQLAVHGSSAFGSAKVLVRNISATGLLLEGDLNLPAGEIISVDLPRAGPTRAKVIWTSGALFGCQFHAPIPTAVLNAAQLQSPAVGDRDEARGDDPAGQPESFGLRLQRMRKDRGLTLSQVAAALGVSKPTVWAWENGKARPIDSRVETLAQVLEVPPAQLLTGRDTAGLQELLASSRERIASALGTSPDKIRILVEI